MPSANNPGPAVLIASVILLTEMKRPPCVAPKMHIGGHIQLCLITNHQSVALLLNYLSHVRCRAQDPLEERAGQHIKALALLFTGHAAHWMDH